MFAWNMRSVLGLKMCFGSGLGADLNFRISARCSVLKKTVLISVEMCVEKDGKIHSETVQNAAE